ncbi:unnamed protein product [Cuscuta campestris]|uniref:Uncharacterized protein n=1 Tax=Cuscuta campestris TaxID=132261 RepID=A0A484MDN8_9ASTE|nr:unnamed protein product [Cuscuta campestris]
MKLIGPFSLLAWSIGLAFICSLLYASSTSSDPLTWQGHGMAATIKNRTPKVPHDNNGHYDPSFEEEDEVARKVVNLEDYQPIDPVPSSKASVRPGPIKHDTPYLPFIPKPPAPPPKMAFP